ncbi:MAG TPA: phosphate signaling complex protein PhoU [Steroidobacteraceae bacterium]|nr:phosphate signaling complex protein PhoU [Steroidobacteraceae bacterium]
MLEGHTAKAFDGALLALHAHVIEMGGLVLDQVREATRAYTDWDARSAERVLEREPAVDAYDARLKEEQINLIVRRQPVASDLRAVIAMSKAVSELERAGDEAKKIARTVLKLEGRPGPATARDARHLGRLAIDLLHLSLQAFDGLDRLLAAEVAARDHDLDEEYGAGLRRLLTRAMEDPRGFEVALQAAFVLKSLERIGDHARNLARQLQSMSAAAAPAAAEEVDSAATPPPAAAR